MAAVIAAVVAAPADLIDEAFACNGRGGRHGKGLGLERRDRSGGKACRERAGENVLTRRLAPHGGLLHLRLSPATTIDGQADEFRSFA
jgi:hypothetical protein